MQTNKRYLLLLLCFQLFCSTFLSAQDTGDTSVSQPIPATAPETDFPKDLLPTIANEQIIDTVTTDTVKAPKEEGTIKDIVDYYGEDYVLMNRKENKVYMYNKAYVIYQDMQIDAGIIILDLNKNEVYAKGIKDTAGNYQQRPVFVQGNNTVEPDSIRFNFDSKKAQVFNSRTQQGEINTIAEVSKKENDSVYFMRNVKFTTAKDIDNPEYYFYARKVKFVPNKKIVTGLTNMYIADVPTPLGTPFGFFPLTEDRASGFIIPNIGENTSRGFFFQNGGYYFAISDYVDLTVLGDYYTNGSYALRMESAYVLRYKFRGNLSLRYENIINGERGFPGFSRSSIYNINWQHSQDPKANPSSRFTASVNLGSQRYYQQSINQFNSGAQLTNTLSSSVSYNKTFEGEPQTNMAITATHTQNTQTGSIDMSLPTFTGSVSRIFPFAPKQGVKQGIIDNINVQYDVNAQNRISTTDSLFFKPGMFNDARIGAQHTIPLTTNFKILNYLSASMGTTYREVWVNKTATKFYSPEENQVVTENVDGFDSYRTYNFSTSLGTTLYGMFNFGKDKKIQTIRHVVRPSISYSITPAFDQYYDELRYQPTIAGEPSVEEQLLEYSRFEGSLYGVPGKNLSSVIGMSLSNNVEAKVRNKDSVGGEPKKVVFLNNLNFSTSYNIAADSLKWSPVNVTGSVPVVEKLDLNFNASLNPYALDNNNKIINTYNIDNGGSLFRLTNANISFNYSFSSSDFVKDSPENERQKNENLRNGGRPDDLFGKNTNLANQTALDDEETSSTVNVQRYNYKIPWDFRMAYTITYANDRRQNEIASHSIMFSGNVELSPRWRVGASSGYDIKNSGFTYTQLRFERDLESWMMNFTWEPFSYGGTWFFFVGIRASMFSDIKYDKRRVPDKQL